MVGGFIVRIFVLMAVQATIFPADNFNANEDADRLFRTMDGIACLTKFRLGKPFEIFSGVECDSVIVLILFNGCAVPRRLFSQTPSLYFAARPDKPTIAEILSHRSAEQRAKICDAFKVGMRA